jgi:hypothetical protein
MLKRPWCCLQDVYSKYISPQRGRRACPDEPVRHRRAVEPRRLPIERARSAAAAMTGQSGAEPDCLRTCLCKHVDQVDYAVRRRRAGSRLACVHTDGQSPVPHCHGGNHGHRQGWPPRVQGRACRVHRVAQARRGHAAPTTVGYFIPTRGQADADLSVRISANVTADFGDRDRRT